MKLNTLSKFLLVAHHPEKGRFLISEAHINYGIIGAALLVMSLDGQIKIEENKLILIKNGASDHPIITEISMAIRDSKKPRKIKYWVTKLARKSRKFKWIILTDLEKNKLLRVEERKFLGLIPYRKTYLIGRATRDNLIRQLRNNALFRNDLNEDSLLMLGLVEACKMHKIITSDKAELRKLKKELKEIIKESPIADTVDETIKQVQAAIIGAIVASSAASATAGAS
jgi:uncharacterized membrane protein YheB (UPF0754 family)